MTSVVAAQAKAAPTIMTSPSIWCGSVAGVGRPKAMAMPTKDNNRPNHCEGWK